MEASINFLGNQINTASDEYNAKRDTHTGYSQKREHDPERPHDSPYFFFDFHFAGGRMNMVIVLKMKPKIHGVEEE